LSQEITGERRREEQLEMILLSFLLCFSKLDRSVTGLSLIGD